MKIHEHRMFANLLWLLASVCLQHVDCQVQESTAIYGGTCTKTCGPFELCFVYENADYCAPFCATGRCNNASICILEGQACQQAPCIPKAICEPKVVELNTTTTTTTTTTNACARTCPSVSSPVCGSNGVSYANKCYMEEAQCADNTIQLASVGLCPDIVALNHQYEVVLDPSASTSTTGTTMASPCYSIVCSSVYVPVCGSDGQTYQNSCFLSKAACFDSRVWQVQQGVCNPTSTGTGMTPVCPSICTDEYTGVCGSNGVLYGNKCLFQKAVCERDALGLPLIEAEPEFCLN